MKALTGYQDRLNKKCAQDPTPVIGPPHLVPIIDHFISALIAKTPKALSGKLPEGAAELLVKAKSVMESLPDVNVCEAAGMEEMKEAMMPHVADNLLPMKLSFDRNCPLYRNWLTSDEGKSFLTDLNTIVDKILV